MRGAENARPFTARPALAHNKRAAATPPQGWWQIGACEVCMRIVQIGLATLVTACVAACSVSSAYTPKGGLAPTPDEMRVALLSLLNEQPEISVPEFKIPLEYDKPILRDGIVYIGPWNCDPQLQTFIALMSAPNMTMYEVSGRFQMAPRGSWVALPRRVQTTNKHDVTEFWRPHEVEPR
jgi:hypothetical protein